MDPLLLALGVTIRLPREVAIPIAILGLVLLGLLLYALLLVKLVETEPTRAARISRRIVGALLVLGGAVGLAISWGGLRTADRQLATLMGVVLVIGGYVLASSPAPLLGALCLLATGAAFAARPLLKPVEWTYERGDGVVERGVFSLTSETHCYYLVPGGIAGVLGAALVFVALARARHRRPTAARELGR